ncbi:MAG: hypothetical protein HC911_08305 [Chloroflexaceae bacterium]|jgi:hypothetical protein|nr:hypothetical protein [Chloroflexaceae bacterium]
MDAKGIIYGETALDQLMQWLHASGQPQELEAVIEQYLQLLRELVMEAQA